MNGLLKLRSQKQFDEIDLYVFLHYILRFSQMVFHWYSVNKKTKKKSYFLEK